MTVTPLALWNRSIWPNSPGGQVYVEPSRRVRPGSTTCFIFLCFPSVWIKGSIVIGFSVLGWTAKGTRVCGARLVVVSAFLLLCFTRLLAVGSFRDMFRRCYCDTLTLEIVLKRTSCALSICVARLWFCLVVPEGRTATNVWTKQQDRTPSKI